MSETTAAVIDKLTEAADVLQDPSTLEMVRVIQEHGAASKLQLLVIGSTGSGRASVANAILGGPGLLPASAVPKAPIGISVRYGPSESLEVIASDGTRAALPAVKLRAFLTTGATGPGRGAAQHTGVEVQAPCELLKTCDLRIEALEAARTPETWRDLLAGADFVFLVLNATALLSHQERELVRQQLAAGYGLQRVALVVNQMDLVPEEEQDSLLELVRTFLGSFESQPVVLPLSAASVLKALAVGETSAEHGYDGLRTVMNDLVERYGSLRAAALRQALEAGMAELAAGIAREQALSSVHHTEVARVRETIDSRREWLQGRVKRTQRKVDTFVGTLLKEELLREIEGFGEVFRRRLPAEIMAVEDIDSIKRHLPGYIEAVWTEFLHGRMVALRSKLLEEARRTSRMIETDLGDLLSGGPDGLRSVLRGFDLAEEALRAFVMPKRGKHHASGAARGLGFHAYIMLIFNPPLGALSLAASHAIRRIYRRGIATADKEAIVSAAGSAARDVERELRQRVLEQFRQLTDKLTAEVASEYAEGVGRIEEFLEECTARGQDTQARREQLAGLERDTLPELRRLLARLDWKAVA